MQLLHGKNQKGTLGAIPLIVTREHGGYQDMDIPAVQLEQERAINAAATHQSQLQQLANPGSQRSPDAPRSP
jgi:hypothetical protein